MAEPYAGSPFFDSAARADDYEMLKEGELAPKTRAWIREADRVIRANNALRSP